MKLPPLYVIADLEAAGGAAPLLDAVDASLAAGARFFQLRAKHASPREYWELGKEVAALVGAYGGIFLTNDRADMALALDADGVHRVSDGMPVAGIRRSINHGLVGISCHCVEDATVAEDDRANFVTISPIWEPRTKAGYKPIGLDTLEAAANAVNLPVFALGGITPERVSRCLRAGAYGVAAMSGIVGVDDPYAATEAYLHAIQLAFVDPH